MKNENLDKYCDSFIIIDNEKNIKNNSISLFNNDSTTVESIYIPLSKKINTIPYKENSKIFPEYKRSESTSRTSSIYIDKKKEEFFNLDFEILEENKIETIKPFKSKCILYDKKNNAYDGNLSIDKNYIFSFIPDKNKNNINNLLYYNKDYYSFSLMYIKNIIPNTNLLGQITYYVEINLKDCRSYLFKLPITTYDFFISTISKYAKPDKNSVFFEKAFSFKIKNNKMNKKLKSKENKDYWNLYIQKN